MPGIGRPTKILFAYVLAWLVAGLVAGANNGNLGGYILGYGGVGALVAITIYGFARLASSLTASEGKQVKRVLLTVFGCGACAVVLILLISGAVSLWQSYVAGRTAAVRQVFLRGANTEHAPEVYMNDGTVWMLDDSADNVKMIAGDEVRYTHMGAPATYWPDGTPTSDSPDKCGLKDVTTGYYSWADRLSAPFTHTSCPAE